MNLICPFPLDKDLGRAYNEAMRNVTDDYAILIDYDTTILTPGTLPLVDRYVRAYPEAAVLTGYASRSHVNSAQHYGMNSGNFLEAIIKAEQLEKLPRSVMKITSNLSGFFMVIRKSTWEKYKFKQGAGCLGIDTDYWQKLIAGGETILLMKTVYVWHTYRLRNGVKDKTHLL